jgi:hypothetical protein
MRFFKLLSDLLKDALCQCEVEMKALLCTLRKYLFRLQYILSVKCNSSGF